MEHKQVEALVTAIDEDKGEVKAVFSVFGNVDGYKDRIMPGAFAKTFQERGQKIAVLDNHSTQSTGDVVGKTISLRELKREELPGEVMARFPEATGAAEIVAKFEPDPAKDSRSAAAFYRLKNGWVNSWSFGYDAKDYDYSEEVMDGKSESIRNLRTIKLWEVSCVIFPANEAAITTGVKAEDKAVMKTEADGKHPAGHYLVVEDPQIVTTWHLQVRGLDGKPDHRLMGAAWAALHGGYRGNVYQGPNKAEAIAKLTALYNSEKMPIPGKSDDTEFDTKAGRIIARRNADRISQVMQLLQEIMDEMQPPDEANPGQELPADEQPAGQDACNPKKPKKEAIGPQEPTAPTSTEAGPQCNTAPVDYIKLIEIEQRKLELVEV